MDLSALSILEANKENMTAHVYFQLKQELDKDLFYEITYMCPCFEPCRDGYNLLKMSLRKAIVPRMEDTVKYMSQIQRDGFTYIPSRLLKKNIETTYFVYDTDRDTHMVCDDEEKPIVGSVYPFVYVEMESVCVTNIVKQ